MRGLNHVIRMKKHGKTNMMAVVAAIAVLGLAAVVLMPYFNPLEEGGGGATPPAVYTAETVGTTIDLFNVLDDTQADNVDVTTVCVADIGDVQVITDTSDPTASNFVKNAEYTCKAVSAANTDQGKFLAVRSGSSPSVQITGSDMKFTPTFGALYAAADVNTQGQIELRVYDNDERAWVYATDATSAGSWNETDGVVFVGTSDNSTARAMGAADELNLIYYLRANDTYQDVNDRGLLILIDASASVWDEPTVTIDGVAASNAKSSLNEDEMKSYSDYEYVFIVDQGNEITSTDQLEVEISIVAASNPGASDDISIDFTPRATYRSTTDQSNVKVGAVTDAASPSQVHVLFDTGVNVS